jgi:hypothetical protein
MRGGKPLPDRFRRGALGHLDVEIRPAHGFADPCEKSDIHAHAID